MAAREHRVSRRALLGAACAIPLVRHPGLDPGSISLAGRISWIPNRVRNDEIWRTAIARLSRAEARLKALEHEPDEDLFDNANAVFNHALKKLVRTPAPDLPALALKIDLAIDHEVAELTGGHPPPPPILFPPPLFFRV